MDTIQLETTLAEAHQESFNTPEVLPTEFEAIQQFNQESQSQQEESAVDISNKENDFQQEQKNEIQEDSKSQNSEILQSLKQISKSEKDVTDNLINSLLKEVLQENSKLQNNQNNSNCKQTVEKDTQPKDEKYQKNSSPSQSKKENKENKENSHDQLNISPKNSSPSSITTNKSGQQSQQQQQQKQPLQEQQSQSSEAQKKSSPSTDKGTKTSSEQTYQILEQIKQRKVMADLQKQIANEFPENTQVEDLLTISQSNVNFGIVLPSNIFEENFEIKNKTNQSLVVKTLVLCLNNEFDNNDEYVYSIRKTTGFDYTEKLGAIIPPYKSVFYKVALKVPNTKVDGLIKGQVQVSVQGLENQYTCPIKCFVEIPNIVCAKSLYNSQDSCNVIKVAIKKGKKQDAKIPFKNTYGGMLNMEFEWYSNPELENKQQLEEPYKLQIHPPTLSVQSNNMFVLNFILKNNPDFSQEIPTSNYIIKKILLMRVKNSSIIFSFPIAVEVY